jgi:hypothetical protein
MRGGRVAVREALKIWCVAAALSAPILVSCKTVERDNAPATDRAAQQRALLEIEIVEKAKEYISRDDPTYPISLLRFEVFDAGEVWRVIGIFRRPTIGYTPVVDLRKGDLSEIAVGWR